MPESHPEETSALVFYECDTEHLQKQSRFEICGCCGIDTPKRVSTASGAAGVWITMKGLKYDLIFKRERSGDVVRSIQQKQTQTGEFKGVQSHNNKTL